MSFRPSMPKLAAILVLGVALVAPSVAQASFAVDPNEHLEAFTLGGLNYGMGSFSGSLTVIIVNSDAYANATYPDPNDVSIVTASSSPPPYPSLTSDDGCGTPIAPMVLGPWDGYVDSTDSCTITYTVDLAGMTPGYNFIFTAGMIQEDPGTFAGIGGTGFMLDAVVPAPPVVVSTDDGTIDFSTGDATADGDYDSSFAPACVTVTKTTSTGVVKTVRHLATTTGAHLWRWHGRNDAGNRVSKGTYRLTVTVGTTTRSRKVVVR